MDTVPFIIIVIISVMFVLIRRSVAAQLKKSKSLAAIDGFNAAVKHDGVIGGLGIALDPATNQFALTGSGRDPLVYDFDQLVAVDVERDGATITTTKGSNGLAGAAIGVALLGPAGVILGAGTRAKGVTTPTVTKLSMKIYVNDLIRPCHEVIFYSNRAGASTNSVFVKSAVKNLDEWYGRFRTILTMKSASRTSATATPMNRSELGLMDS